MKSLSTHLFLLLISISVFSSCKNEKKVDAIDTIIVEKVEEKPTNSIHIVTRAMEFQMQDTIPSGWNTFTYKNLSNETHFVVFEKYPEGITIDSTKAQVFPVFQKGLDLINEGKNEEGFAAFNALPAWFFNVEFTGGIGLVSPQNTAISTIKLDPGRYLIECYVKMKNGTFHSVMGMYKEIIVSTNVSSIQEPKATVQVTISAEKGITCKPTISSGEHLFKIHFTDQKTHENFVGHDVNLVRLSNNADVDELEAWMNWANPKGLIDPAPENITFIGGVQEMAAGKSGYFNANLKPGKYALISEVPDTREKGLYKEFEVKD
jgi:hypothetical protein